MKLNVCLDQQRFFVKPEKTIIIEIGNRLPSQKTKIELIDLAYQVGEMGRSFTSAQFSGLARLGKDMTQMQIFGIDIDHGVTIEEAMDNKKLLSDELCFYLYFQLYHHEYEKGIAAKRFPFILRVLIVILSNNQSFPAEWYQYQITAT